MQRNQSSKRFRVIIFTLTALMIAFAWVHSLFPADLSSRESEGVFQIIYRFFSLFGAGQAVTQTIIRKLAHFSEFAAIGFLLLSCGYTFDRIKPHRYAVPVLFTGLLTAVIDEELQLGIEGRAGMITDVWIDFGGVVCGFFAALAFYAIVRKIRKIH